MALPGLAAIDTADHRAQLDPGQQQLWVGRRERDALHVGRERATIGGREPPEGANTLKRLYFGPMRAAVTRNEQPRRLGPHVDQARLSLADRQRLDNPTAQAGWPPGRAAVVGAEHALALRAGVDHAGME